MRTLLGWSVQITMSWAHAQSSALERWYLLSRMRITLMWRIWPETKALYNLSSVMLNLHMDHPFSESGNSWTKNSLCSTCCAKSIRSHTHENLFPLPGWSWSRHCGVRQHVPDTSPRHQYSFGTPWLYGALRDSRGVLHVSAETKATVSGCCSLLPCLPPFRPPSLPLKPSVHPSIHVVPGAAGQC